MGKSDIRQERLTTSLTIERYGLVLSDAFLTSGSRSYGRLWSFGLAGEGDQRSKIFKDQRLEHPSNLYLALATVRANLPPSHLEKGERG